MDVLPTLNPNKFRVRFQTPDELAAFAGMDPLPRPSVMRALLHPADGYPATFTFSARALRSQIQGLRVEAVVNEPEDSILSARLSATADEIESGLNTHS